MTGIFKEPMIKRLLVKKLNIEGDAQADLRYHGGPFKAVYSYAGEHYLYWRRELGRPELPYAAFGENFTTSGLKEEFVMIGDQFRFGQALLEAVQPRLPCYKLGLRFGDPLMPKKFLRSMRLGIYFQVIEEGAAAAQDEIIWVKKRRKSVLVSEIARLYASPEAAGMRRLLDAKRLIPYWRAFFDKKLKELR